MSLARYDELVRMGELEVELVRAGRLDEVDELQSRRAALVAGLPATPPVEARPALERAAALQREVTVTLATGARAAADELSRVDRGRTAARSYAPAGGAARRTLDRSA